MKEYCQVVEQLVSPFEGKSPRTDSSEGAAPPAQSSETMVITNEGGVYTIRLNRPSKKNALLLAVSRQGPFCAHQYMANWCAQKYIASFVGM